MAKVDLKGTFFTVPIAFLNAQNLSEHNCRRGVQNVVRQVEMENFPRLEHQFSSHSLKMQYSQYMCQNNLPDIIPQLAIGLYPPIV